LGKIALKLYQKKGKEKVKCIHFGSCGSCDLYNLNYQEALIYKQNMVKDLLKEFYNKDFEIFSSVKRNHRNRAEFRIWHEDKKIFYAMTNLEKNSIVKLNECPKVIKPIENIMWDLLKDLEKDDILKDKLFAIEFLGSNSGELLVTLIYHKKLNEIWEEKAKNLEEKYNILIIGRSKKQKIVISKDYIFEKIYIDNAPYIYKYYDTGFTQPNSFVNQKMISWAKNITKNLSGDLLELYCGLGNFTLPLSKNFNKVLATEVSKASIKAAKENCKLNNINNIFFARLNASESAQALRKQRSFNRLKNINLDSFDFSTILVDPPRAGLDSDSLNLAKDFKNVIYISCNPLTLARDLKEFSKTHIVKKVAIFDQFPYTKHIESGVFLERF
jgi:tRNA (uracil-5-)-methyltransferase